MYYRNFDYDGSKVDIFLKLNIFYDRVGWGGGIGSYPLMEFAHYSNIIIYLITISPELQYYLHTTYT